MTKDDITTEVRDVAWEKAKKVKGYDASLFRKDACGAWIRKDLFGDTANMYGWGVDLVFPRVRGGKPVGENVRALNSRNLASKGRDYPSYKAVVTAEGTDNVVTEQYLTVNAKVRQTLKTIFPDA